MIFIVTGDNEHPEDIKDVITEEEEVVKMVGTLSETGVELMSKTGSPDFVYMTFLIAVRLGIWVERNMPESTEEHLGEGMTLEELRNLDRQAAAEESFRQIAKLMGLQN